MRPFIINNVLKVQLADLAAYAVENPITMNDMLDVMNGAKKPAGDNPRHYIELNEGFKIVYSIEQQPKGDARHLSVGVLAPKRLPNPEVVKEIMKLIGFKNKLSDCKIWIENITPDYQAINVTEYII